MGKTTYDFQDQVRDVSPVADLIIKNFPGLLSLIGDGSPAMQTKVEWKEDALNSFQDVIANGGAIGTSDLTFSVTTGTKFRINDIVAFEEDTGEAYLETMRVTGVSTNLLTVSRQYNGQTKVSIADGDTIKIVSRPSLENTIGGVDESLDRGGDYNHTEIFIKFVEISRTQQTVKTHGVSDELNYQVNNRLLELVSQFERALIFGARHAGSATQPRTTEGILTSILRKSTALKQDVAGALTAAIIDQGVEDIITACGIMPNVAICHPKMARKISGLDSSGVVVDRADQQTGRAVYSFRSAIPIGQLQQIIVVPEFPKDQILLANTSKIKKRWMLKPQDEDATAKGQDGVARKITSEMSYEYLNSDRYHKLLYNINL